MVKKEEKVKRVSRNEAANQVVAAVKGKTTLTQLAEKANALVVESGGPDKVQGIAWHVKRALASGEAFGILKITRPTDVMVERVKS